MKNKLISFYEFNSMNRQIAQDMQGTGIIGSNVTPVIKLLNRVVQIVMRKQGVDERTAVQIMERALQNIAAGRNTGTVNTQAIHQGMNRNWVDSEE